MRNTLKRALVEGGVVLVLFVLILYPFVKLGRYVLAYRKRKERKENQC